MPKFPDDFDPSDLVDNEEDVVNIDTAFIDDDSMKEAEGLIENLKDLYADPSFMQSNPKFATRLRAEIEDLRILLKVRKSDEAVHDILLGSIGKNSSNASLYRALTDVQKTILSTTSDISAKIKDINTMLKNIQLELNFNQNNGEEMVDPETGEVLQPAPTSASPVDQNTYRGSKDFIKQMRQELDVNDQTQEKESE